MHDIRLIRTDPAAFDAAMARRGLPAQSSLILELDEARRTAQPGCKICRLSGTPYPNLSGV